MRKENLQFILKTLARIFENSAQKGHIEEFKAKYKGVRWNNFMIEKNISF